jgi:hypothetical protein
MPGIDTMRSTAVRKGPRLPISLGRSWRLFGASVLILATLLFSSQLVLAQFAQQGPKLVGTGSVGPATQGFSVSLSADGNTAIVGGKKVILLSNNFQILRPSYKATIAEWQPVSSYEYKDATACFTALPHWPAVIRLPPMPEGIGEGAGLTEQAFDWLSPPR